MFYLFTAVALAGSSSPDPNWQSNGGSYPPVNCTQNYCVSDNASDQLACDMEYEADMANPQWTCGPEFFSGASCYTAADGCIYQQGSSSCIIECVPVSLHTPYWYISDFFGIYIRIHL